MGAGAEELTAVVREIRERVRARYSDHTALGDVPLPDLLPLLHARDAAEGKVAAIGSVNPRGPGLLNSLIQRVKRLVARSLDWHVREQIEFNRAAMECIQATLEALNETSRALTTVAGLASDRIREAQADFESRLSAIDQSASDLRADSGQLRAEVRDALQQFGDIRTHWTAWRRGQETRITNNEITFLKSLAESHSSFQHRVTTLEAGLRDTVRTQHSDFTRALANSTLDIQKRLWDDLDKVRAEFEAVIHRELRVVRQRMEASGAGTLPQAGPQPGSSGAPNIDWLRFADRFRGAEENVRRRQQQYVTRLEGRRSVLDLGCGRGELLAALRDAGIPAHGVDANEEFVRLCHSRGLDATHADIFEYLAASAPDVDAIAATHVVEHLPPAAVPKLIGLIAARLAPRGLLIIETPNPESLASFALHFFADPTHTHPLPPPLLAFYLEEAGFGGMEVLRLNPLVTEAPEAAELPAAFRQRFFGSLDYAIIAHKL
ncbi:MAG TPA: methyltransferase domain-containing protein [Bryobacteraceae bacterium]|nr:methyltransferase domain-containing protein [Bryobacteraceae bacterium]